MGALEKGFPGGDLTVNGGGKGGALKGCRQGVGGKGFFVIDSPPLGQGQAPRACSALQTAYPPWRRYD